MMSRKMTDDLEMSESKVSGLEIYSTCKGIMHHYFDYLNI